MQCRGGVREHETDAYSSCTSNTGAAISPPGGSKMPSCTNVAVSRCGIRGSPTVVAHTARPTPQPTAPVNPPRSHELARELLCSHAAISSRPSADMLLSGTSSLSSLPLSTLMARLKRAMRCCLPVLPIHWRLRARALLEWPSGKWLGETTNAGTSSPCIRGFISACIRKHISAPLHQKTCCSERHAQLLHNI